MAKSQECQENALGRVATLMAVDFAHLHASLTAAATSRRNENGLSYYGKWRSKICTIFIFES